MAIVTGPSVPSRLCAAVRAGYRGSSGMAPGCWPSLARIAEVGAGLGGGLPPEPGGGSAKPRRIGRFRSGRGR
jgi:hypothetical protein